MTPLSKPLYLHNLHEYRPEFKDLYESEGYGGFIAEANMRVFFVNQYWHVVELQGRLKSLNSNKINNSVKKCPECGHPPYVFYKGPALFIDGYESLNCTIECCSSITHMSYRIDDCINHWNKLIGNRVHENNL